MQLEPNAENSPTFKSTYLAYVAVVNLFYYTSFFSVTATSLDSFLGVRLHLRYQELVTHKCVVAAVISIWFFGALFSLTGVLLRAREDRYDVYVTVEMSCLITAAPLYYNIFLAVRRHTKQIHTLQIQRERTNSEMANAARLRKSAIGTFYLYLVFLFCYLPQNDMYFATFIYEWSTALNVLLHYSLKVAFLNSSLNPLIYCWKMTDIRHAVIDILQKILPSQN